MLLRGIRIYAFEEVGKKEVRTFFELSFKLKSGIILMDHHGNVGSEVGGKAEVLLNTQPFLQR